MTSRDPHGLYNNIEWLPPESLRTEQSRRDRLVYRIVGERAGEGMERRRHKTVVQIVSLSVALLLMVLYASVVTREAKPSYPVLEQRQRNLGLHFGRKLLDSNDSDVDNPYCHNPMQKTNSCQYVKEYCSDDVALINYLEMVACNMARVKVSFIIKPGG